MIWSRFIHVISKFWHLPLVGLHVATAPGHAATCFWCVRWDDRAPGTMTYGITVTRGPKSVATLEEKIQPSVLSCMFGRYAIVSLEVCYSTLQLHSKYTIGEMTASTTQLSKKRGSGRPVSVISIITESSLCLMPFLKRRAAEFLIIKPTRCTNFSNLILD